MDIRFIFKSTKQLNTILCTIDLVLSWTISYCYFLITHCHNEHQTNQVHDRARYRPLDLYSLPTALF